MIPIPFSSSVWQTVYHYVVLWQKMWGAAQMHFTWQLSNLSSLTGVYTTLYKWMIYKNASYASWPDDGELMTAEFEERVREKERREWETKRSKCCPNNVKIKLKKQNNYYLLRVLTLLQFVQSWFRHKHALLSLHTVIITMKEVMAAAEQRPEAHISLIHSRIMWLLCANKLFSFLLSYVTLWRHMPVSYCT